MATRDGADRRRAGPILDRGDLVEDLVECRRQGVMHLRGVGSFDEPWSVSVALEQLAQLVLRDAGQNGRVGDLVPVEVKDGQDGSVAHRIEELVRVPRRGERAGFRFTVADDTGNDEIRIVERRPVRVRQRVAELTPFVDRTGRLRRHVRRDAAGEGELAEQPAHAVSSRPISGYTSLYVPSSQAAATSAGPP